MFVTESSGIEKITNAAAAREAGATARRGAAVMRMFVVYGY